MRKIAIVLYDQDRDYDYDNTVINTAIHSITDWTEVTDEEYALLVEAAKHRANMPKGRSFMVVARPADERSFIYKTVEQYKEMAAKWEAEKAAEKLAKEEKRRAAALKKRAKDEAAEKALLAQLQAKYPTAK